jgi:hypothetical protein
MRDVAHRRSRNIPCIVELNLPASRAVNILAVPAHHLVGNDVNVTVNLVAQELFEQGNDDRAHASGQNDDGHVVLLSPVVKLLKVWVKLHVLLQDLDALVERGLDAVEHFTESVTIDLIGQLSLVAYIYFSDSPEAKSLIKNPLVQCLATLGSEAKVVNLRRSVLRKARKGFGHKPCGHCL